MAQLPYARFQTPIPVAKEAGWNTEPIWMQWRNKNLSSCPKVNAISGLYNIITQKMQSKYSPLWRHKILLHM
jgi:hypothetical protein